MVLKKKKIKLGNRIFILSYNDESLDSCTTIEEGFLYKGKLKKSYRLLRGGDYCFSAYTIDDYDNFNTMSFKFDINHPLYLPLLHLINYENKLIIDDDDTRELIRKYMIVYRHKNSGDIYLDFNNFIETNRKLLSSEKFSVFIKNIVYDGRSKIDEQELDTKDRLAYFYKEVYEKIMNEDKQISIEEYLFINNLISDFEALGQMFKIDYIAPYRRIRELHEFKMKNNC